MEEGFQNIGASSAIGKEYSIDSSEIQNKESYQKLEILIPVFNEAENIKSVILDFYNEIGKKLPITMTVAEDGSNDGTREILRSLKNDLPISLFSDTTRKGYAKAAGDVLKKS